MKLLITGRSGVGKSTTVQELARRGYTIYDTDDMSEVSRLEVKATGEPVEWPEGYMNWDYYAWRWQKDAIEKLLASEQDVIIGAIMSNQKDFYHLFDLVIVLTIPAETLRERLENRTREFNNDQKHIDESVGKHERSQRKLINHAPDGAISIDNNRPVTAVANEIERVIDEHRNVATS